MSFSLPIEIAGVSIQLALPTEASWHASRARYAAFACGGSPAWRVGLDYDSSLNAQAAPWIAHEGPLTRFFVAGNQGWMDFERKQAHVSAPRESLGISAVERVMGYICMQELPRYHDALLLHGVGIVIGGEGHLFFGASGRGKSTVGRLADGVGEVLSDELAIVQLGPAGPRLRGTPFWSTGTPTERIREVAYRDVPLAALYSLHHSATFELTPLAGAQAVMELLTSEKVATERASSADAWLAMASRVVSEVAIYKLGFRPTKELWTFLEL